VCWSERKGECVVGVRGKVSVCWSESNGECVGE